jgi:hypothetical protein
MPRTGTIWRAPEFLAGVVFAAAAIAIFFGTSAATRIQRFVDLSRGPSPAAFVPPLLFTGVMLILAAVVRRAKPSSE